MRKCVKRHGIFRFRLYSWRLKHYILLDRSNKAEGTSWATAIWGDGEYMLKLVTAGFVCMLALAAHGGAQSKKMAAMPSVVQDTFFVLLALL